MSKATQSAFFLALLAIPMLAMTCARESREGTDCVATLPIGSIPFEKVEVISPGWIKATHGNGRSGYAEIITVSCEKWE